MKKFTKVIISGFMILLMGLILTACSTGSESSSNEKDISGIWIYEGPSSQDPTYYVELNLDENKEFELIINDDILADLEQDESTTIINGTYEDDGTDLVLTVKELKDGSELLEKEDKEITLGYELSGDSELLTVTGIGDYFKDLPESIAFERGNANS